MPPRTDTGAARLEGWNLIPRGYGVLWDLSGAPWWLRLWFHTPFADRFAHPHVVKRGCGWLSPHPGWPLEDLGRVDGGWRTID